MEEIKVSQQINNVTKDNLIKLEQLFPSVVKDGKVDFEALKAELGDFEETGSEKFELTWAGKTGAKKIYREDIVGRTLKLISDDGRDIDTTENLYIEGDNLEVLKLIRQNYYGSVKMIYIDPPYNTGNDFVYNDSFSMDKNEAEIASGNVSELGERFTVNKENQNRYHANWLNMMYPRLRIAKDLLADDGVIFISIDDNEQANLTKLCDEIFGADNCLGPIIQNKMNAKNDTVDIQKNHEFILVYRKSVRYEGTKILPTLLNKTIRTRDVFCEGERYYYINDAITTRGEGGTLKARPNLGYTVYYNSQTGDKIAVDDYNHETAKKSNDENAVYKTDETLIKKGYYPIRPPKVRGVLGCWTWALEKFNDDKDNIVITGKDGKYAVKKRTFVDKDEVVSVDGKLQFRQFDYGNSKSILDYSTNEGTNELSDLLGSSGVFSNPKNKEMLKYFISLVDDKNITVLDFFSGSSTTAQAVMELNANDKGNRKFIMVQLPELIEEGTDTYALGYKSICDIGKERIRRAGDSVLQENPGCKVDVGFKVFRVDNTNIKWNSLITNGQLDFTQIESTPDMMDFMPETNDIDVVYEIMLRQRDVPLSESIEKLSDIGERTYLYADAYLICLETEISTAMIDKLAAIDPVPVKYVFRDSAFKDDIALKDETFRRLKAVIEKNTSQTKQTYTVEFI